ncbi:MAG TPA: DUF3309 family protein [Burkholderiales bacterium]|nr:DUF3309 family protein [Burkholderiales bacterium]
MSPISILLIVLLIVLLVGAFPAYTLAPHYGYGLGGIGGILLIVLVVLLLTGRL